MSKLCKSHSIFFYIKPDKNCYYPDDKHAIKIKKISDMIKKVRIIKNCIGSGKKSKKEILLNYEVNTGNPIVAVVIRAPAKIKKGRKG